MGIKRDSRHPSGVLEGEDTRNREKWTMGILNDKETDEVPGTVMLLASKRNEPLGFRHQTARNSASSLPSSRSSSRNPTPQIKRTADGKIVLDPQPDDSLNDPLNWPVWRRDMALLSLGLHSLLGGGMTPILAAGYQDVMESYNVTSHQVALTTGLYMLGLGLGSVIMSPTAILWGKRPVYLGGAVLFIISAVWCALSPSYASLVVARVFQGIAVSPVECLPSATIAEIFFLHERAYRVGIYTLLLLGGKNLVPLVAAVITQSLGWRWVFWIVSIIVGFCLVLLFFFVPETFWDRTPRPRTKKSSSKRRAVSDRVRQGFRGRSSQPVTPRSEKPPEQSPATQRKRKDLRVDFADDRMSEKQLGAEGRSSEAVDEDYFGRATSDQSPETPTVNDQPAQNYASDIENGVFSRDPSLGRSPIPPGGYTSQQLYTRNLRARPLVPYTQSLKVCTGRIAHDKWLRAMVRPLILFAYPAVLWSAMVYALSVGWLIVLSEAVAEIYRNKTSYNFSALTTGLVYISPFIGGILGTAVAGKVSDLIVRVMTRRNGGIYEPEFRLVMALPIAITTAMGLMGFGWSAHEKDQWIVPTVFFGILSFGCCLGSTTSITFCVDSYRQYAGEALVTLNFCKNVLHGFIFSLFFVDWLLSDGAKTVFLALGGIHLACMLFSIPMYIYGKRARMWTVRRNLMEKW